MGRTVPSFHRAIERFRLEWSNFRRALRVEDKAAFDKLMDSFRSHADAGSLVNTPNLAVVFLVSALIDTRQELERLSMAIQRLQPQGQTLWKEHDDNRSNAVSLNKGV